MKKYVFTLLLTTLCAATASAQNKPTLQERIPQRLIDRDDSFLTFTIENDLFGSGKDENYTNGARITYYDASKNYQGVKSALGQWLPFFNANETTGIHYSLGQNLYTPEIITTKTPDPEDRPYAGFLYGSIGASTITNNHLDELELTLGVVGPWALGEEVQKAVHDAINADDPSGWDAQLKNEPAIIIAAQRLWPEAISADLDPLYMRVAPHIGTSLGNVYTHANAGVTLQLTPKKYRWQSQPLRVRPAIPGSGYFAIPEGRLAWSAFAGLEGRAVARNIFLDGNSFQDSSSVDKKHLVADINGGFTLSYGRIQTSYTLNWRSNEFDNQSDNSLFGAISLGYRF
jgi:lipid A 3-O-deacylase